MMIIENVEFAKGLVCGIFIMSGCYLLAKYLIKGIRDELNEIKKEDGRKD